MKVSRSATSTSVVMTLPNLDLSPITNLLFSVRENFAVGSRSLTNNIGGSLSRLHSSQPRQRIKKILPVAVLALFVFIVLVLAINLVRRALATPQANRTSDQRVEVKGPRASLSLQKEISIPIRDSKGTQVTTLKYLIDTAELRDEIIVKGQPAIAIKGRTFLILTIRITNNYNKSIDINARDYVRLMVNQKTELLAPDIHNDPVTVQALSTKYTRLGFPINDTDKNLTLKMGELDAEKQTVPIKF